MNIEQLQAKYKGGSVLVSFSLNEENWNKVVGQASVPASIESEGADSFVIEYLSLDDCITELNRLEGMVEYTILTRQT